MVWTRFHDMHSGGRITVEPYEYIYIEAPRDLAETVFRERLNRSPHGISCHCCGPNFSIRECPTLKEATQYQRESYSNSTTPLNTYVEQDSVLVIRSDEFEEPESQL